ncbi:hypothetical protein KKC08_05245 [Patescibacteria group bacterium]|nr:hypothetical protein [Patescibacteria group bacterium]MCG2702227.1 hypothetical protein [Candidatus Parcubacteria bacterium]MBU4264759.1 hypothetical protein [Patescibacteria group bacterium]MBU4390097.1 hypothetical protein [Patescibacteria group bacterium]MBU4397543.1 hypothetical protein [Patescibacteria group bacterium]
MFGKEKTTLPPRPTDVQGLLRLYNTKGIDGLGVGELSKIHHLVGGDRELVEARIRAETRQFWNQDIVGFRMGEEGQGKPKFADMMQVLGVGAQMVGHIKPRKGSIVSSWGDGGGFDARYFRKSQPVKYLSYDDSRGANGLARTRLDRLGMPHEIVDYNFYDPFPVEKRRRISEQHPGAPALDYSSWALTYTDPETMTRIIKGAIKNGSTAEEFWLHMLEAGKFDSKALGIAFMTQIFPRDIAKPGKTRQTLRALFAVPAMINFGEKFQRYSPLWTVAELKEELGQRGLKVEEVGKTLFDQSVVARVTLS